MRSIEVSGAITCLRLPSVAANAAGSAADRVATVLSTDDIRPDIALQMSVQVEMDKIYTILLQHEKSLQNVIRMYIDLSGISSVATVASIKAAAADIVATVLFGRDADYMEMAPMVLSDDNMNVTEDAWQHISVPVSVVNEINAVYSEVSYWDQMIRNGLGLYAKNKLKIVEQLGICSLKLQKCYDRIDDLYSHRIATFVSYIDLHGLQSFKRQCSSAIKISKMKIVVLKLQYSKLRICQHQCTCDLLQEYIQKQTKKMSILKKKAWQAVQAVQAVQAGQDLNVSNAEAIAAAKAWQAEAQAARDLNGGSAGKEVIAACGVETQDVLCKAIAEVRKLLQCIYDLILLGHDQIVINIKQVIARHEMCSLCCQVLANQSTDSFLVQGYKKRILEHTKQVVLCKVDVNNHVTIASQCLQLYNVMIARLHSLVDLLVSNDKDDRSKGKVLDAVQKLPLCNNIPAGTKRPCTDAPITSAKRPCTDAPAPCCPILSGLLLA